jgi:hypothetical protein
MESKPQYYWADLTRMSWPELWRLAGNVPLFLVAAFIRLCGLREAPTYGFTRDNLRFIEPHTIPDDVAIKLKSVTDTCAHLGFRPCFWTTTGTIGSPGAYSITMLNNSGTVYAKAAWARAVRDIYSREKLIFEVVSRLTESRFVVTTNDRMRFSLPRDFQIIRLPEQDVLHVLNKHHERLSRVPGDSIVRLDEVLLQDALLEASKRIQDFLIERGVYVPLSENQVAAIISRSEQSNTA